VLEIINDVGAELRALTVNADGSPRHPLYVAKATVPNSRESAV
jgi:hypothetical protein